MNIMLENKKNHKKIILGFQVTVVHNGTMYFQVTVVHNGTMKIVVWNVIDITVNDLKTDFF